jgi:hypothetical protein
MDTVACHEHGTALRDCLPGGFKLWEELRLASSQRARRRLHLLGPVQEPVRRRSQRGLHPGRHAHPQEGHRPHQGRGPRSGSHAGDQIAPRRRHPGKYSDLHSLGVEPRGQVLRTLFGFGSFQMQVPAEPGPGGLAVGSLAQPALPCARPCVRCDCLPATHPRRHFPPPVAGAVTPDHMAEATPHPPLRLPWIRKRNWHRCTTLGWRAFPHPGQPLIRLRQNSRTPPAPKVRSSVGRRSLLRAMKAACPARYRIGQPTLGQGVAMALRA